MTNRFCRPITALAATLLFGGCAATGAPTHVFFGAYFPDWLLYGLLAVFFSILTRVLMIKTKLDRFMPYQLFVCTSIGFTLSVILWMKS